MAHRTAALLLWLGLFIAGLLLVVVVVVPQQRSAEPHAGYNPLGGHDPSPVLWQGHAVRG